MSTAQQAKDGLKTFILTFTISLLVFGAFYYLITDSTPDSLGIEEESSTLGYTKSVDEAEIYDNKKVTNEEVETSKDVKGASTNSSPFGELSKQKVALNTARAVLAGTDTAGVGGTGSSSETTNTTETQETTTSDPTSTQTPQSSVPETGDASITIGFLVSTILLAFFAYLIFVNPRKYALSKFEKDVLDDNDK